MEDFLSMISVYTNTHRNLQSPWPYKKCQYIKWKLPSFLSGGCPK